MARYVSPEVPPRPSGITKNGGTGWSDIITKNGWGPYGTRTPGLVGTATEPSASGTKYYVGDSGSDSNSGTSKSDPFATFAPVSNGGSDELQTGDVLVILEEGVTISNDANRLGIVNPGVTVCGEDGTFPKVKIDYTESTVGMIGFGVSDLVFRGFWIDGPNTLSNIGTSTDGSSSYGIRMDNANTGAAYPSTKADAKAGGWVYNVKATHMGNSGIMWGGTSVGGVAEHCHAAYNYGPAGSGENSDGIQMTGAPDEKTIGGWIEKSLTNHNSDDGVDLFRSEGVRVFDHFNYAAGYREDGSTTGVTAPGKGIKLGGSDGIDIGGSIAQRCVSLGNGGAGFGANGSNLPVDFINCTAWFNARKSERDYEKDYELFEYNETSPSGFNLQNSRIVNCIGEKGLYVSLQDGTIDSTNVINCNFDSNNNFGPSFSQIPFAYMELDANDYPINENQLARIDVREDAQSLPGIIDAGSDGYVPTPASDYHDITSSVTWNGNAPDLGAYETT